MVFGTYNNNTIDFQCSRIEANYASQEREASGGYKTQHSIEGHHGKTKQASVGKEARNLFENYMMEAKDARQAADAKHNVQSKDATAN